jgi:hypothetical protein
MIIFVGRAVAFVSMIALGVIEMSRYEPRPMVLMVASAFMFLAAMPLSREEARSDSRRYDIDTARVAPSGPPPPKVKSRAEREYDRIQRSWDESLTRHYVSFLHGEEDREVFERHVEWVLKHRPTAKVLA